MASESEAKAFPTGDLDLVVCSDCGFISNDAYVVELSEYSARYEESQAFSAHFAAFADEVARTWVERHDLRGKRVVEIGCGKGDFLAAMARHGIGSGVGIDPAATTDRIPGDVSDRLSFVRGWFPQDLPDLSDANAVICRHTLEHIGPVRQFLADVRTAMGPDSKAVLLFELPDGMRVLLEGAFWDVYYEHCSYFTQGSLARLFANVGFRVLEVSTAYDDQYLLLEACLAPSSKPSGASTEDDVDAIIAACGRFSAQALETMDYWTSRVSEAATDGRTTVLWGGSSKAVAFLKALGAQADSVLAVVDINPRKQGSFLAGTGHRVISPDDLTSLTPDLVIAMNPVYVPEIRQDLEQRGLSDVTIRHL